MKTAFQAVFFKTAIAFGYVLALHYTLGQCPIKAVAHIPCPTCGMTRAWLALCGGHFREAFAFHPLFWVAPIIWICFCVEPNWLPPKWQKARVTILLASAFAYFAWWIRLMFVKCR